MKRLSPRSRPSSTNQFQELLGPVAFGKQGCVRLALRYKALKAKVPLSLAGKSLTYKRAAFSLTKDRT